MMMCKIITQMNDAICRLIWEQKIFSAHPQLDKRSVWQVPDGCASKDNISIEVRMLHV
jgi:hypothetical protein